MIDIPEEIYNYIHNEHIAMRVCDSHKVAQAIANGTLLPKGHGRLIDADDFEKRLMRAREYYIGEKADNFDLRFAAGLKSACERLIDSPTIIEADKESKCEE